MHLFIDADGNFYKRIPGDLERTPVVAPSTPKDPFQRMDWVNYRAKKATILVGQYVANLIWLTDVEQIYALGMSAASAAPVATIGSGTGITANSVQYVYTFAQIISGVVRVEGAASAVSNSVTVNNKNIAVTGLPTSATRATHKRLYRSDNGGLFRHVANIALATDSYNDTTSTLSLGAPLPDEGTAPPQARFVEIYHERAWYVSQEFPDRIYYSEIGEPEVVGTISYVKTLDGEPITGIARCGDELIFFGSHVAYRLIGHSARDFVIKKISPTIGCISHFSIVNINEVLFFAAEQGVFIYDGSFRFIMEDLEFYWKDLYGADPENFQDSQAADDRVTRTYKLLIPQASSFAFVAHYDPVFRGEQGYWVIDTKARKETAIGNLYPPGSFQSQIHSGSCDGFVREDNDATDGDDDTDASSKEVLIQTGAILFSDPGGDDRDGKTFPRLWSYVQSEGTAWTFYAIGGEEDVVSAGTPDNSTLYFMDARDASIVSGKTAQGVHYHGAGERISGRALQIRVAVEGAAEFSYRGFGGLYGPGPSSRPPT